MHKQLVTFFSDTALSARGFRPKISPADVKRLQYVIRENILTQTQFEQIMLFFLADKRYRNLGPSIATMLSSTILNSLRNHAMNRETFYRELELYRAKYLQKNVPDEKGNTFDLAERIKKLSEKMSVLKSRTVSEKKTGEVGLFNMKGYKK